MEAREGVHRPEPAPSMARPSGSGHLHSRRRRAFVNEFPQSVAFRLLATASAPHRAGLFANSANIPRLITSRGCILMPLSRQGLLDSVPIPPCWASPPDPPGLAEAPCQALDPHAGTQHGLLCLARSQHNFLSQPHSQLWITPVHSGRGRS